MDKLLDLYSYAESKDIDVDWFTMERAEALSMPIEGGYGIALDPWKLRTIADEYCKLAHEIGHCETGSFYSRYATRDVIQQHENRADKWAIKKIIPKDDLDRAVSEGHTELYDLAEYFGVTEDFMRKAFCWYKHGTLATKYYF